MTTSFPVRSFAASSVAASVAAESPDDIGAFLTHIARCHNVRLPGGRLPFRMETPAGLETIGWVDPVLAPFLRHGICAPLLRKAPIPQDAYVLAESASLRELSAALQEAGAFTPFDEWFDVRSPALSANLKGIIEQPTGASDVIGQVDRGLIPLLGVEAYGVHLNGLVRKKEGTFLWVARRSLSKRLDPGKLDHLVAGGMSAGLDAARTLVKEAGEEAAIPPALAGQAEQVSQLRYTMARPEGLRRDVLICYDLKLPESFTPRAADGEVESFQLLPLKEVFALVRDTDAFKFNVNLVLIDLFLRHGLFPSDQAEKIRKALFLESASESPSPPC